MKRILQALLLAACALTAAAASPIDAARALVARVIPGRASQVSVELIPRDAGHDVFEVETLDGKLVLRGNDGVAVGSALGWYLRNVAHAQLSWDGDNLALPAVLPPVPGKVRIVSPYQHRVYLNYCTFDYTAAWWDRARWEREIDWMALHGITTPLAATGQSAVWQATLRRFGMSDGEIRTYLSGPAFHAWQWMTNLEQWGGPLPQSWIDSHLELGRFILQRERELGMTPILQGFSGCVPLAFIRKFPDAKILPKKIWCEVGPGTAQVDPDDPLFERFGRAFLEEQTRLLGTDHLYADDPFHEGEPPDSSPAYLNRVGAKLYRLAHDFDRDAVIVMQGWTIREGIVKGIPADRLLALDLTGQKWRETDAFWGRPWVAGVLHNYGGRAALGGNLPLIARNAPSLLGTPKGGRLVGIGLFPEAIGHNPMLYDLATDIAWHRRPIDLPSWVHAYVFARYGRDQPSSQNAWRLLLDTVYSQPSSEPQMESPLQARPALTVRAASPWGDFRRDYPPAAVWNAWADLLDDSAALGSVDTYRYDVVEVGRQALADLSLPLQREITAAFESGDRARYAAARDRFLALGADLDRLLGTRREYLLGRWLDHARRWGANPAEKDLYERNARELITVWGPDTPNAYLFDYSCRQWSGLIRGFYLERWRHFFAFLETQPATYRDARFVRTSLRPGNDASPFYRDLDRWEYRWCDGHESYPDTPLGDPVATARELLAKWRPAMLDLYPRFDWKTSEFKHQPQTPARR